MLIFGLKVALIGIGIVFLALIFLIFVINVIGAVTKGLESRFPAKEPKKAGAGKKTDNAAKKEDDTELVAVIAAAIAASNPNFLNIRTINRVPS